MPGAAGPVLYVKYSQTIGAGTSSGNKQFHQLGARIAGNLCAAGGSLGADRGPRIGPAGPDRWAVPGGSRAIASRSCARWAVPGHMFWDRRARPAGLNLRKFAAVAGPVKIKQKKTRRPLLAGGRY